MESGVIYIHRYNFFAKLRKFNKITLESSKFPCFFVILQSMTDTSPTFKFKSFGMTDRRCGMKIGTDGVLVGAWAECPDVLHPHILDVGAGCGVISLMMAQRYERAIITAVEVESGASEDFTLNIELSPFANDRFSLIEGSFHTVEGLYDLIVSNPPFFTNGESSPLQGRALARHASELSPLSLVHFATKHLQSGGRLAMIVPVELTDELLAQAAICRLWLRRRTDVATSARRGVTRALLEFSNVCCPIPHNETLVVNSPEYANLTKNFYLHY